ncbi:P-loop containing nucleoside triphosphate hydrolase protein [Pseudoneurospora amorphoporcata]|uniref:P-loop containing nucleoside triphosphate hydrolase protein n=1 Tax=Pseudoneurospora amorphoporcata TaxID=241081 RepID=A0AAN6SC07_9PEZI|nr:P-loop containing nucleoside triphosphate hydrolase protein [Pseudoneurospora amorphoporcata]
MSIDKSSIIFVFGLGSNPDTTWRAKRPAEMGLAATADAPKDTTPETNQFVNWVSDFLLHDLHVPPAIRREGRIFYYNYDSYWQRDALHTRLELLGKGLLKHIRGIRITEARLETPPPSSATIPFSRDPDFVNRGDILDQIDQRCSKPAARVALVGLGGIGKSQLAIEFAHRIAARHQDTWVFWVHAGTQARVDEGFRAIADAAELPGRNDSKANILQLVYGWLSNERNGKWVMVLDSADDRDVFFGADSNPERRPLAAYLPQSPNGCLLVTTRNKDLAFRLTGKRQNMIEIRPMAQIDALALLEKKLGSLSDTDIAVDLVRALDLVPLTISQAAAYIQRMSLRSSPEKYLDEFRKSERNRRKLLQYDGGDLRRDGGASNAILTTWQISFDHIRSKRPSAANLLSLMSFFDRQGIPGWVLNPSRIAQDGDVSFEDDVAMLRDYCLITADETEDKFKMHGLQYIERMAASFPTGQFENWAICRTLFAYARVALDYQPSENTVESWAILLYNGGWYAWSQGRYEDAQQMLDKARKVRKRRLGKDDVATLSSTSLLAAVLRDKGLWKEAEKLEVQVMETSKTKFGADHPDTLTSMNNLASTYRNQGRWDEAEKLDVQVMEIRKAKLGANHPNTLTSMANLASTFWKQGRWEEAEKLEVQVMETRKAKLGADHPDTLTSMANLAFTWNSQGRHEDALALMQACVEVRQRVLGPEHPDTLSSLATVSKWSS